jgi:hypothetical protein
VKSGRSFSEKSDTDDEKYFSNDEFNKSNSDTSSVETKKSFASSVGKYRETELRDPKQNVPYDYYTKNKVNWFFNEMPANLKKAA